MFVTGLVQGTWKNVQKIWQGSMTSLDDVIGVFMEKFANFLGIRPRKVIFSGIFVPLLHLQIFFLVRYVKGLSFECPYRCIGVFIAEL